MMYEHVQYDDNAKPFDVIDTAPCPTAIVLTDLLTMGGRSPPDVDLGQ